MGSQRVGHYWATELTIILKLRRAPPTQSQWRVQAPWYIHRTSSREDNSHSPALLEWPDHSLQFTNPWIWMACDYLDRIKCQRKSEEMRRPLPQGWESAAEQAAHLPAATTHTGEAQTTPPAINLAECPADNCQHQPLTIHKGEPLCWPTQWNLPKIAAPADIWTRPEENHGKNCPCEPFLRGPDSQNYQ